MLFILGLLVILYPFISDWLFSKTMVTKIENQTLKYRDMTFEEIDKEIVKARKYNDALRIGQTKVSSFHEESASILDEYYEILNIDNIMCVLDIPKIDVKLSVYHGIDDTVLMKGIGHIKETSLPIGGGGTHSYLAGHTGLMSAKLLSDLDELQIGDRFYIDVLDERLAYCVDNINVVAEEEFSEVEITENGDFITLVTCTPEGINSHRLLVRGARILDMPVFPDNELKETDDFVIMFAILALTLICIILLIVITRKIYLSHIRKNTK